MAETEWAMADLIMTAETQVAFSVTAILCRGGCGNVHLMLLGGDDVTVLATASIPPDAIDALCGELQRLKNELLGVKVPNVGVVGHG